MKKILLFSSGLLLSLASFGQVINTFPYNEDFETELTGTSCGGYVMQSIGWANDLADSGNDWTADIGGTGSFNTGPSVDYNPGNGTGHYIYTETSGCSNDTRNLESPWFDFTIGGGFEMSFAYHMFGGDMGTMSVDYRDGINGAWTQIVAPMTDNLDMWQISTSDITFLSGEDSVQFRIVGMTGPSFESDMAIDDFTILQGNFQGIVVNNQNNVCFGQSIGSLTANNQFGVPPISYAWDNGDTTQTITGLAAGTYCCTMTDANLNTVVACGDILDLASSPLEVFTSTINDWICTDSMGGIVIDSITGGQTGLPMCGSLGVGCSGTQDTLQSDVSDAVNSGTTYPAPLGNWYWGNRHQMSYTPTELAAAGVQPGNIYGLGFEIQSMGTSTTTIDNFTIYLGCATDSVMTGYMPTTEVRAAATETIGVGWNYYTFDTPFYWDGTSVIIVETCLNNTGFTNNPVMSLVNTSYTSCVYYRSDATGNCGNTSITGTALQRPVIDFMNCQFTPTPTYFYSWDTGSSADTTYVPAGLYTLTVTDDIGCTVTATEELQESAPVNIDDQTICETNPFVYSATAGFDTYMWNTGETTGDITITTGGTYYVDAVDSLGCPTSDTAFVSTLPPPVLAASPSPEFTGNDGSIVLSIYGNAFPFIVDWDNDGTGDNDDPESIYGLTAGDYTVVVTDTNGCFTTLTVTVDSWVGLDEETIELVVFPNPVKDVVTVQLTEIDDNTTIQLIDIQGQVVVAPMNVVSNTATIDMSALSNGIYFIRVAANGTTREVKVVKQ